MFSQCCVSAVRPETALAEPLHRTHSALHNRFHVGQTALYRMWVFTPEGSVAESAEGIRAWP